MPSAPPSPPASLGFSFRLVQGAGRLTLENQELWGWLDVERLELEVPHLTPPVDLAAGPTRFQNRRTQVESAALRIGQRQLDALVSDLAPQLVAVGADRVSLRPSGDHVAVSARFREAEHVADLVATIRLVPRGGPMALVVDRVIVFGFLPTPAPVLAHRLLQALTSAEDEAPYPGAPVVRGLGLIEMDTLPALLWHTFPPRGWRLPDPRRVALIAARPTRHGVVARFARDQGGAEPDPTGAKLLASMARHREAERALRLGDLDAATRDYRTASAAGSADNDFVFRRLLAVAAADRTRFAFAVDLARDALSRWPDLPEAHAAVATVRLAQGDDGAASERYRRLSQAGAAIDDEVCSRAALVGARLAERSSPERAAELYERVCELHPGHSEATDALLEHYRQSDRLHDRVRLLRARIAASTSPETQLADRLALAELYLEAGDGPSSARDVAQMAVESAPESGDAEMLLARSLIACGDRSAATMALERAAERYAAQGDRRSHDSALLQAADIAADEDDPERALQLYQAILSEHPDSEAALVGAARALAARGRGDEAALLWQRLIDSSTEIPEVIAGYSLELGRELLALAEGDDETRERAVEALRWAAGRGPTALRARARLELASALADADDPSGARRELDEGIRAMTGVQSAERDLGGRRLRSLSAELHLARARLHAESGDWDAARVDHRQVFELGDGDHRIEAARSLLALARRRDDAMAERRWLDVLTTAELAPDDRAQLLLDRARLQRDEGERDGALADLDEVLRITTDGEIRAEALEIKASLLEGADDPLGRAHALTQKIELAAGPFEQVVARTQAARAWLDAERPDEALQHAQAAAGELDKTGVDYSETWLTLGDAAWRKRAWGLVITCSRRLLRGTFDVQPAVLARHAHRAAIALDESGDIEGSAEAFEDVVKMDGASPELRANTHRLLATLYERLDRPADAAAALEAYATAEGAELPESSRSDAWYRAGELYRRLPEAGEDAERCLENALKLVADHLPALDALERIKREGEDYERVAVILGRKIAATARHPNRQKSLLARLADLQHLRLGRTDVARQSYARALEIDPDFRPALRFVAQDARERGDHPVLSDALARLSRELESDLDLSDDAAALAEERKSSALSLADMAAGDPGLAEAALSALEANLEPDHYDDQILEGIEKVLRAREDWRGVADVLGQRAAGEAGERSLDWDLERIRLLADAVGDVGAALTAARAASARHPGAEPVEARIEELESRSSTAAPAYAPGAEHIRPAELRAEADVAYFDGEFSRAAELLEKLVSYQPLGDGARHFGSRAARGELFLQLADIYYDHLDNLARARESMRRAAEAFGSGSRRDATLRLLASEAMSHGAYQAAADALESIDRHRLTGNDRLQLARALTHLERDYKAIEVLEAARVKGSLGGDGAKLLTHLYRERERKSELADSLERGAADSPPAIAETRLREALNLFENALASAEGAERVRKQIAELRGGAEGEAPPTADDLERAAEAALQGGDSAVAADLLSRAVHERTRVLGSAGREADTQLLAALDRLRRVSYTVAPAPDLGGTGHFEALVRGILSAATVSTPEAAVALRREAAAIKRNQLRDPRGAADALARAFSQSPADPALFAELAEALRDAGDYGQLIAAYELRLQHLEGPARSRALAELARVVRSARGDHERARRLLAEANEIVPPEADENDAEAELDHGAELELAGKRDEAIAHYYAAFTRNPSDCRPLEALDRLYGELGDTESQANVLGQLIELADSADTRGELWYRRAKLYRDVLRREHDAYRCMAMAYANAPDNAEVANALRTMAMARGEWPLAAELLYREIAAAPDIREQAALQLELALIYDQKLLDPQQAMRNYQQALDLDPSIPAAPAPLARLYEHHGRDAEAARTFELAAEIDSDPQQRRDFLRRAARAAGRAGDEEARRRLERAAGDGDEDGSPPVAGGGDLDTLRSRAAEDDDPLAVARRIEARMRDLAGDSARREELADLSFELGRLQENRLGDTSAAVVAYRMALDADPHHPSALDALARIAYLRSDWEQARELFARIDPQRSELAPELIAYRQGEVAEMLGLDSEAAASFATAVSLAPKNVSALAALMRAAVRIGDVSGAIDAARSRLEAIPTEDVTALTAARLELAELCDANNDIVTAIYYYELVLAEDPNNRHALEKLVSLYAAHGDPQGAIRTLRSLIAIADDLKERAEWHYTLGEIYRANVGDHEAAAGEYLKAIDLDPDNVPTLRRLLDYYWALDDDEALREIAEELHGRDQLIVIETPSPTLARVMMSLAVADSPLAVRIADSLPGDVSHAAATVMLESLEVGRSASAEELAEAAAWLAENVAAVSREALADHLGAGEHDRHRAALYAALLG